MNTAKKLSTLFALTLFTAFFPCSATAGKLVPYHSSGMAQIVPEFERINLPKGFVPGPNMGKPVAPKGISLGSVVAVDAGKANRGGKYTAVIALEQIALPEDMTPEGPSKIIFFGPTIITDKFGDSLVSVLNISFDLATGELSGEYMIVGGTGRWAGASGEGITTGTGDATTGAFVHSSEGTVSKHPQKARKEEAKQESQKRE